MKENIKIADSMNALLEATNEAAKGMKEQSDEINKYARNYDILSKKVMELTKTNEELANSYAKISRVLNQAYMGNDLAQYIQTQDQLQKSIKRTYEEYNKQSNRGAKSKYATELYKQITALKAISGDIDLSGFEEIKKIEDVIPSVSSYIQQNFSIQNFKEIAEVIQLLQQSGLRVKEVFNAISKGNDFDSINEELNEAREQLELMNNTDVTELSEKLKALSNAMENEFSIFLKSNNLSASDTRFEEIFEDIRSGAITAQSAIQEVKSNFGYLLERQNQSGNQNYDFLNTPEIEEAISEYATLRSQIEEMYSTIVNGEAKVGSTDSLTSALNPNGLNEIVSILNAIEDHLYNIRTAIYSIDVDNGFKDILSVITEFNNQSSKLKDTLGSSDVNFEGVSEQLEQISASLSTLLSLMKSEDENGLVDFANKSVTALEGLKELFEKITGEYKEFLSTVNGSKMSVDSSSDTSNIQQQIDAQNTLQEEIKETQDMASDTHVSLSLDETKSQLKELVSQLVDAKSKIESVQTSKGNIPFAQEIQGITIDLDNLQQGFKEALELYNQLKKSYKNGEAIKTTDSFGSSVNVVANLKDIQYQRKVLASYMQEMQSEGISYSGMMSKTQEKEVTGTYNKYVAALKEWEAESQRVDSANAEVAASIQNINSSIKELLSSIGQVDNYGLVKFNGMTDSLSMTSNGDDIDSLVDKLLQYSGILKQIDETNVSSGNTPQDIGISTEETQHLVEAQEQLKEASLGVAEANEKVTQTATESETKVGAEGESAKMTAEQMTELYKAKAQAAEANARLQQSAEDTASSFESEGKSAEGISSSTGGIKEEMDAATSSMRETTKASEELEKAVKGVSGSLNVPITIDSGESNMFDAEIRKIVEAAEEANRTITNIDAYTKSETKLFDPSDATAGIETIKKLDKAIVTYADDAGKASKAVYELVTMSAQDDEGNMTSQEYWVESSSKFVQNYQKGTSEIEKVMSARNKAIVNLTNKVTTSLQNAENANTKNTISDVHLDEIRESYNDIISMINDLSSINFKSDIDDKINEINLAINKMGNALSGFKVKDTTAGSLKPNTIQTEFATLSASLDVLKAKVKSSGVEISEDLQKYMDDASAVINKGFDPDDSGMSKTLQKLRDDIKMARAELSALSAEDAGANKTSILENNKSIAKDNLTAYQDSLKELGLLTGDTKEKVQELFQSLDHVSNSSGLTEWRSQLKAVQAQLKDTIAEAKNSKASEVKITGWEEQIHDLQQVQTQTTAYKDKLSLLIQKVNEYKSLDVFGTDKEKASALSSEINKLANELNKGVLTGGKYSAENSKGVLTNYSGIKEAEAAYTSLGYTITSESDNAFVAINKVGKATKTLKVSVGETDDEIRSLESTDYGKGVVTQINGIQWALNGVLNTAKRFAGLYLSPYRMISAIKESVSVLKEFDSALTQISYTMDMSQTQIDNLGESILTMANNLGTSVDDAMEVAAIYANMKTTSEEIQELAQPALILSNLTGSGASQMADSIQAVKNAFGDAVGDAEHIADVMDYVSQNIALDYATGINDISEAVEVAGASAEAAGVSFEQLSSIVGVTAETTRQQGSNIKFLKSYLIAYGSHIQSCS